MSWTWRDELKEVFEELGGVADYSQIRAAVERRGKKHWISHSVRQCIEDHSSDSASFRTGNDLFYSAAGIGKGVWGLRGYVKETPDAIDKDLPARVVTNIFRILRDTKLTKELKGLYDNCCQVCGDTITLPNNIMYSEAHHLKPLGGIHKGLDAKDNMIVLCPNHHVAFDYGSMAVEPETLKIISIHHSQYSEANLTMHKSHVLDKSNLEYHYINIYNIKKFSSLRSTQS